MRLLVGLFVSMIIAVGGVLAFYARPAPVVPATAINPERIALNGLAHAGKNLVAAGELGHILISEDEGKHWTDAQITPSRGSPFTQLAFFNDKDGVAVGHDGWIVRTADGGRTWKETRYDENHWEPLLGIWGKSVGVVYAFGNFGTFLESQDRGLTWQQRDIGSGDKHLYAMAGSDDGRLMLVGEQGLVMRSNDNGANWQVVPQFYIGTFFGVVRASADEWIAYGMRGNIYYSKDFGETWRKVETPLSISLFGDTTAADGTIYLVGEGGVTLASRDHGSSFEVVQQSGAGTFTAITQMQGNRMMVAGLVGVRELTITAKGETK